LSLGSVLALFFCLLICIFDANKDIYKTAEQISPVNGLEPWDQSDRQKPTKAKDKIC